MNEVNGILCLYSSCWIVNRMCIFGVCVSLFVLYVACGTLYGMFNIMYLFSFSFNILDVVDLSEYIGCSSPPESAVNICIIMSGYCKEHYTRYSNIS